MSKKAPLTIEFDNPEARRHFALWLCESGEQAYWDWMKERERKEQGPITARDFDYHGGTGTFLGDGVIRTTTGRLTKG